MSSESVSGVKCKCGGKLTTELLNEPGVYRERLLSMLKMIMAQLKYTAVLNSAEEGGFVIKCLELPVATQGETKEEAVANLKEAIQGYLEIKAEKLKNQEKTERVEIIVEAPSTLMA